MRKFMVVRRGLERIFIDQPVEMNVVEEIEIRAHIVNRFSLFEMASDVPHPSFITLPKVSGLSRCGLELLGAEPAHAMRGKKVA